MDISKSSKKRYFCYKVLVNKNNNGYLITPFQKFALGNIEELPITIEGGKYKSIKQNIKNIKHTYRYTERIIFSIMSELKCKEEGYIHAFYDLFSARLFVKLYYKELVIVKCIIPKGTLFHIAFDGKEICARKMILLESII